VTVNPIPVIFAGNDITVCEDESIILTASGAIYYTWDNGVQDAVAFNALPGSTTYTVTGTTVAGCSSTDQLIVTATPAPVVSFTPDVTLGCVPLEVNFTNTTPNVNDCSWSLGNGDVLSGCGTVNYTFESVGCYDITLTTTDAIGCTSSLVLNDLICVEGFPEASIAPSANNVNNENPEVIFFNNTTGASSYVWDFGDLSSLSNLEEPTHVYPTDTASYVVMLIATSPAGCVDTAYTVIRVYEELLFYVPNTFTPDGDTYNPIFLPILTAGFNPYSYNLKLFNRWGEIIFESNDPKVGWDGSYGQNNEIDMVQDGLYTWIIELKVSKNDERKRFVGHVNLLR
jgi:gliding motility-associated-like protein